MSFFRKSPAKKALFIVTALLVLAALPFAQQAKKPKVLQSTNPELRLKGFEDYKAMQQASKFKDFKHVIILLWPRIEEMVTMSTPRSRSVVAK